MALGPGGADQRLQLLRPADEVTVSVVTWADDGVTVEGLLGLPAGAGPHPMFVFLHGGPVAGLACGEHPDPSGWVSSGLAFFMPDFRSAATSPAASSPAMTAFAWPYPAKASPACHSYPRRGGVRCSKGRLLLPTMRRGNVP